MSTRLLLPFGEWISLAISSVLWLNYFLLPEHQSKLRTVVLHQVEVRATHFRSPTALVRDASGLRFSVECKYAEELCSLATSAPAMATVEAARASALGQWWVVQAKANETSVLHAENQAVRYLQYRKSLLATAGLVLAFSGFLFGYNQFRKQRGK